MRMITIYTIVLHMIMYDLFMFSTSALSHYNASIALLLCKIEDSQIGCSRGASEASALLVILTRFGQKLMYNHVYSKILQINIAY